MSNHESYIAYLKSWSEELTARANRVRQLIGGRHWLTDGHHKEVIVREFLKRYLPVSLEIGSGFIKSKDGNTCSPEIDILISDSSKHPAYFNEGGIQILPPSSAVAYIEMKSTFSASSLFKAIEAVSNTQLSLGDESANIWRCICFTSVDSDFTSFSKTVIEQFKKHVADLSSNSSHEVIKMLPTCIASFGSYIVFIRENIEGNSIVLTFFEFEALSAAIAFSDLFEHIRNHFGHIGVGELSALVENLQNLQYAKHEVNINND